MSDLIPSSRCQLDQGAATRLVRKLFGPGSYCYRSKGLRKTDGFDGYRYYVANATRGREQVLSFGRSFEEAIDRAKWFWSKTFWPRAGKERS